MKMIDGFTTTDFAQGAFLETLGHHVQAVDRSDPQRVRFVFAPEAAALAARFWDGDANAVPARDYYFALRRLHRLLRGEEVRR